MRADPPGRKLDLANRLVFTLIPLVLVLLLVGGFLWWQRPERSGVIVRSRALAALPEAQLSPIQLSDRTSLLVRRIGRGGWRSR